MKQPRAIDVQLESQIVRPIMPELDTIRGIAILLVFFYHAFVAFTPARTGLALWSRLFIGFTRLGWPGVNIFFVLSGFLITGILVDSAKNPNYYSRFYYRRALRILPAYYAVLLVLIIWERVATRFDTYHGSLQR